MNLYEHKYTTWALEIQESVRKTGGRKGGNIRRMVVAGRPLLSGILSLALQKGDIRHEPGDKPIPLLLHPHPCCRLRRAQNVMLLPTERSGKCIPAAAVIANPTVRMKYRFATPLALPNQPGATPHAEMLPLLVERKITTLRTNSTFV